MGTIQNILLKEKEGIFRVHTEYHLLATLPLRLILRHIITIDLEYYPKLWKIISQNL